MPLSAKSAGRRSHTGRTRPSVNTKIIKTGKSQSARSPPRARSNPLAESFIPIQLTCTHGRKKQISTDRAALRVVRLAFPILNHPPGARFSPSMCNSYAARKCVQREKRPSCFDKERIIARCSQFFARSKGRSRRRRGFKSPMGRLRCLMSYWISVFSYKKRGNGMVTQTLFRDLRKIAEGRIEFAIFVNCFSRLSTRIRTRREIREVYPATCLISPIGRSGENSGWGLTG